MMYLYSEVNRVMTNRQSKNGFYSVFQRGFFVVLFAACVCLAASHSITRDLLGPNPDLFSELENVKIDEPANTGDVPFKNCGTASDLVSISSINLTPFPAKKGPKAALYSQSEHVLQSADSRLFYYLHNS